MGDIEVDQAYDNTVNQRMSTFVSFDGFLHLHMLQTLRIPLWVIFVNNQDIYQEAGVLTDVELTKLTEISGSFLSITFLKIHENHLGMKFCT